MATCPSCANEVRTARQVTHPNVCRVYDIGEFDGQHYLFSSAASRDAPLLR